MGNKKLDITGNRYGMLVAISDVGKDKFNSRLWEFMCDCGNTRIATASQAQSGRITHCGCQNVLNLIGQVFGRLTVLEYSTSIGKKNETRFLCRCECGKLTIVRGSSLTAGYTKSCGCYQKDRASKPDTILPGAAARRLYEHYKRNARIANREFLLTLEEFVDLCSGNCFYCGTEPQQVFNPRGRVVQFLYNGIDRYINSIGYLASNCVSCCKKCNYAKRTMDGPEYLDLCRRVAGIWNNRDMEDEKRAA